MSKWNLPTQKGTELWPSATRSPTRLLIEGVQPGSPLAVEIAKRFAGEIGQFYAAQAQNYTLGVATSAQGISERPGLRLRYQNTQGKETLRVQVAEKIIERIKKEMSEPKTLWDWAVIEVFVTEAVSTFAALPALFVRDLSPGPEPDDPLPYGALISDFFDTPGTTNALRFPDVDGEEVWYLAGRSFDTPTFPRTPYAHVGSLRIDAREIPPEQVITARLDTYDPYSSGDWVLEYRANVGLGAPPQERVSRAGPLSSSYYRRWSFDGETSLPDGGGLRIEGPIDHPPGNNSVGLVFDRRKFATLSRL